MRTEWCIKSEILHGADTQSISSANNETIAKLFLLWLSFNVSRWLLLLLHFPFSFFLLQLFHSNNTVFVDTSLDVAPCVVVASPFFSIYSYSNYQTAFASCKHANDFCDRTIILLFFSAPEITWTVLFAVCSYASVYVCWLVDAFVYADFNALFRCVCVYAHVSHIHQNAVNDNFT